MKLLGLLLSLTLFASSCSKGNFDAVVRPPIPESPEASVALDDGLPIDPYFLVNSTVTVGTPALLAGETSEIRLQVLDQNSLPVDRDGMIVGFAVSSGTSQGEIGATDYLGAGVFRATFTATGAGTALSVRAAIGGTFVQTAAPTIQVIVPAPVSISYALNPVVYSKTVLISPNTPQFTGGTPQSYSISPALPAGVNFSTTTGTISGTPAAAAAMATYVVTASNPGGSVTTNLTLTVNDLAPSLTYPQSSVVFSKGLSVLPITPSNSGGPVTTCISVPTLPAGLVLDSNTCRISGTPSVLSPVTSYLITPSNSGGTGLGVLLSIRIDDVAPSGLTYATSPAIYQRTVSITNNTVSLAAGGPPTAFAITPALPSGLVFNPLDGSISGTPNVISSLKTYTVTASNTGGSTTVALPLRVTDVPPNITFAGPVTLTRTVSTSFSPSSSGGTMTSCASVPSLPAGLALSSACLITGTPTVVSASSSYTVTATNTGGSGSATLTLAVNELPPTISYSPSSANLIRGVPMSTINVSNSGGPITGCTGTVPTGLTLSAACVITGTPTIAQASTGYLITASNAGGTGSFTLNLAIVDTAPAITFPGLHTFSRGTGVVAFTPANTGGPITGCSGTLPPGISIAADCTISGTPTAASLTTGYSITATNSVGSSTASVSIKVTDIPPALVYTPAVLNMGSAVSISPTNTGGLTTGCSSSPATLPAGLVLASDCSISGTPTALSSATVYTITASNPSGSSTATVSITVNAVPPSITFPATLSLSKGMPILPLVPTNSGGPITGCTGTLPAGLTRASDCTISGAPTAISSSTSYTLVASNSGGSSSFSIFITVNDQAPNIQYATTPSYVVNSAATPLAVTNIGGTITGCSAAGLPAGLSISSSCTISGTPTAVSVVTPYLVTATNTGGSNTTWAVIGVNDLPPVPSYSPSTLSLTRGVAMTAQSLTNTGGAVTSCASTPTLPAGLSLSSTCAVSGTPTAVTVSAAYSITGTNSGGSVSASLTVSVQDSAPSIAFLTSRSGTLGSAITAFTPTNTGGAVTNCVSSSLSAIGLSVNPTTCQVSGAPSVAAPLTAYSVTASNAQGSSSASVSLVVLDQVPVLSFGGLVLNALRGAAITSFAPSNSGGTITSCTVSPSLPAGLSLAANCTVSGTPATLSNSAVYTVTATNSGGSASAAFTFSSSDLPAISFSSSHLYVRGVAISSFSPTNSGGTITGCSAASLPAGLSINTTCQISGTPSAAAAMDAYSVTATNALGSSTAVVSIRVIEPAPVYSQISPQSATAAGGATVAVSGTGFQSGAVVTLGTTACTTTSFVNSTSLNCVVPANATIGTVNVTVTNPDSQSVVGTAAFSYVGTPGIWFKANLGVTQVGGFVSDWIDESGNALHASQSVGAAQPAYVSSVAGFASRPVIRFSGAQYLNLAALSALDGIPGSSVFVVANTTDHTVSQSMLAFMNGLGTDLRLYFGIADTMGASIGTTTGDLSVGGTVYDSDSYLRITGGSISDNTAFSSVGRLDYSAGSGTLRVNRVSVSTGAAFQTPSTTIPMTDSTAAYIGTLDGATKFFQGDLAEVIVYPRKLTGTEAQAVEAYLKSKFGLP